MAVTLSKENKTFKNLKSICIHQKTIVKPTGSCLPEVIEGLVNFQVIYTQTSIGFLQNNLNVMHKSCDRNNKNIQIYWIGNNS